MEDSFPVGEEEGVEGDGLLVCFWCGWGGGVLGDPVETFNDIVDVAESTFAVCDVWSSSGDVEIVVE